MGAADRLIVAPTTNEQFLSGIFGRLPADVRPMVCGFAGNPKDKHPSDWTSWAWTPGMGTADDGAMNWYFTLATYRPTAPGNYSRKRSSCTAVHGVMLDDIGTKAAPRSRLAALPPSVLVETSAGNYQAVYLFDGPCSDLRAVEALQRALIVAGLCDPKATGPSTRNCRMPFGVNGKHSPPFSCRLVEWHPERRYTIADIRRGLALPDVAPKRPRATDTDPRADWEKRTEADRAELVEDLRGALAVIPSDDRDLWIKFGMCLRASLPDGPAFDLWADWSRKSVKCDEDDLEYRFGGFEPDEAGHQAIFAEAPKYGWKNPGRPPLDTATLGFGVGVTLPAGASPTPPAPPPPPFVEVQISDLATATPEPQVWWCAGYLPAGHVTLLGGHGGAGKSTIALMLAANIAAGAPFLGQPCKHGRVLYFSAEDPGPLVRRRLAKVCHEMGLIPAALAQSLRVLDATETAPVLFAEQRAGGVRGAVLTATYDALAQYIEANGIDVLIADNSSDLFDADEINRAMVRAFVRSLAMLVRKRGGAVLLLAHVDKTTSRAGKGAGSESYSGSTAWHNSVRSRLFLTETGPGALELRHEKSNLGGKLPTVALLWPEGRLPRVVTVPVAGPEGPPGDDDLRALLALIEEFTGRGEWVPTAMAGTSTIAHQMKRQAGYPTRLKPGDAFDLMRDAERRTLVKREKYTNAHRKERERWIVTDVGRALIASAAGG
jgi:AAA domain/Primase C terminal 2 (PriCT-2)/RepB DNA-primase from phage plasmid